MAQHTTQPVADEWVTFPGGELEGRRPKMLCAGCRELLKAASSGRAAGSARTGRAASPRTLCFQCYRAELDRDRALRAAGEIDTASPERFQAQLPFEPVDRARLTMLKAERMAERGVMLDGTGRFVDARRQAQIAARHALQRIIAGVATRNGVARGAGAASDAGAPPNRAMDSAIAAAIHAAELQLPESWLPFVVSR